MKKLKAFIAVLLCAALLPALPALRSAAYDGSIFTEDPDSCAATLGLSEEQFDSLVGYLYESIAVCRKTLALSAYNITVNSDTLSLLCDIITNYPKAFHVKGISYSHAGGMFYNFILTYKSDINVYRDQIAELEAAAADLTAGITPDVPEALKVALLHDRLASHCRYSDDYHPETGRYDDDDYTAYGALVGRKAICQGYSRAFAYLLDCVGVKSYYCPSNSLNHVWNIVFIDGVKYHVDVTWDDPVYDIPGRLKHWGLIGSSGKFRSPSSPNAQDAHNASDYDTSPDSTLYDDAFWNGSQTQLCLLNGSIYYVDYDEKCIYAYNYSTGVTQFVSDLGDVYWPAGTGGSFWMGCYTRLDSDGQYLYLSLPDGIRRFDPVATVAEDVFLPDMPAGYYVYGFELTGRTITCLAAESPNIYDASDAIYYTYELDPVEFAEPVVSGVVDGGVYEGEVTVSWDVGEGTLDGSPFDNGGTVSAAGAHRLTVVNGDKSVTVSFTVSAAQPPANKGDMDGDGAITVADALKALRIAAKLVQPTAADMRLGDIDADGVITVADALKILRVAAKLATSL